MKILVGTHEICRQAYDLAAAFRTLGHEAETVMVARNPQHPELVYDHVYDQGALWQHYVRLTKQPIESWLHPEPDLVRLRDMLTGYDAYVFQFSHSLLPFNQDFPILRRLGKKILSLFNGSDIRHWSAAKPIADKYGYHVPDLLWQPPYNDLNSRMHNLRMAERYADALFGAPGCSQLAVRPYWQFPIPVDLSRLVENVPRRDVPVVVHAPSRRGYKGTTEFLEVLERLEREGIRFDLRLLEDVPNREVLRELTQADVVLDQLNAPNYAMLALEGMATGCVVAGGRNPNYMPFYSSAPVYEITREGLYEQLKRLLTSKDLRTEFAVQGRSYVERTHGRIAVAEYLLSRLETSDEPDYFPTFVARRYHVPEECQVSDRVRKLTAEVVQRHGLPHGVTAQDMARRGLLNPDVLDASRPITSWQPLHEDQAEEIWGWSRLLRSVDRPGTPCVAGTILHHVSRAIRAVEEKNFDTASGLLQECITLLTEHDAVTMDAAVLKAIGRLARELNEPALAAGLWRQAAALDPDSDQELAPAIAELDAPTSVQAA
ncbi:MAG: hypothetical protein WD021_09700 [Rhodothermales bacterium]